LRHPDHSLKSSDEQHAIGPSDNCF
jgi:hypothetical protein